MMESKLMKKVIKGHEHVLLESQSFETEEMLARTRAFYHNLDRRRSVRSFSDRDIPRNLIEDLIKTAGTAPSGAHKQPWTFCAVSNPAMKTQIREAAEEEERELYEKRISDRWRKDLTPLATDANKPFLEIAPWLIVVFKKAYDLDENKDKNTNYYVNESVGIACGLLITAIHQAGLVTLTHTPSPMNFLTKLLKRPENERAFLLLPVGYPADEVYVPNLQRKPLDAISEFYE